jgi:hypothetical protein
MISKENRVNIFLCTVKVLSHQKHLLVANQDKNIGEPSRRLFVGRLLLLLVKLKISQMFFTPSLFLLSPLEKVQ